MSLKLPGKPLSVRELKSILLIWFLSISLLPLGIVVIISYKSTYQALKDDTQTKLTLVADFKSSQVQDFLQNCLTDVTVQSRRRLMGEMAEVLREAHMESGFTAYQFTRSPQWMSLNKKYRKNCEFYLSSAGYDDLLIIDLEGNILYSVRDAGDLGINLFSGKHAGTNLSKACLESLQSKNSAYSDLEKYAPLGNKPCSFVTAPICTETDVLGGLIALRLNTARIDSILHESRYLGETGEAYIVGPDLRMRSNSIFENGPSVLKNPVRTKISLMWQASLQAEHPVLPRGDIPIYDGPRAIPVIGLYRSIQIGSVPLGLIVETQASEAFKAVALQKYITLGLFMFTAAVVTSLAFFLARRISSPIIRLSNWGERVAAGDLSIEKIPDSTREIQQLSRSFSTLVHSFQNVTAVAQAIALGDVDTSIEVRGEKDVFGKTVNEMGESLRAVVRQAAAISRGDYTLEVHPRSARDELGSALSHMVGTLRENRNEREGQDWLKSGQANLNDKMRGEQTINDLSQNVIDFLTRYIDAQVGAIYIAEDNGSLRFIAGHACHGIPYQIPIGQGLTGQAAREKTSSVITQVPPDYLQISSGLGNSSPGNLLIVPFLFEGTVKGVMEFGSFHPFEERHLRILDSVSETIAIAVHAAESRARLKELLEKTQSQAEELLCQQEELRVANKELEEQTEALKASETKLQAQQEELLQTNEELEAQARALEDQQRALELNNAELEEAQKEIQEKVNDLELTNRYKSEFLANMSHELRTPLNSVLLLSSVLTQNKEGNLTSKQVESIQVIHSSGSDLLALINEILDLSKVEAGKMAIHLERVNLADFAQSIENEFEMAAGEKGLTFKVVLDRNLSHIETDGLRLGQIVRNLLSNAFRFTSEGGVTLEISRPNNKLTLSSRMKSKGVIAISVHDTGIGIPEQKQKLIFEAFQQVDGTNSRKYGGTGLGLTISEKLARLLGGEIHLTSREGEGSVFTLLLPELPFKNAREIPKIPVQEHKAFPVIPLPSKAKEPFDKEKPLYIEDDQKEHTPGDRSVLVIEDDKEFAKIVRDLARDRDFKVIAAQSGEAGLRLAELHKPSAIILDIGLPGMDGWAVIARLKGQPETRHIPVHFVTAADRDLEAFRMGAIDYTTKPLTAEKIEEIFERIETAVSKKVKDLLVIASDKACQESILKLLSDDDLRITSAFSGKEACEFIDRTRFDCIILEFNLNDMPVLDLLAKIKQSQNGNFSYIPVIIYSSREIPDRQRSELQALAQGIVLKEAKSPERLLDEVTLFLHRVEAELPEAQKKMLRNIHDRSSILRGRQVLLVDDDMRNLYALTNILETQGMKITAARNGREALDYLEKSPETEVILMDIMMPEMDGYEAIAEIRKQDRFKKLPIIALTAKAMREDRYKCIEAGASDYLSKPVDPERLFSMLRVWLYQ